MRIRMLVLTIALACPTFATAQPTVSKPDEVALPSATRPVATVIRVSGKRFGSIKTGKKLTLATVTKAFPGAKLTKSKSTWKFADPATKLAVVADSRKIVVDGGPVEAYGVAVGDDGGELATSPFAHAYCFFESAGVAVCNQDSLSIKLLDCPQSGAKNEEIERTALKGCKVQELTWTAYYPGK